MTERKVFMNSENIATFVCPECQRIKNADVSKYKEINKAVRVKCRCSCGHTYTVLLERRRFYRKEARLSGSYLFGPRQIRAPMMVKDLSRTGLRFEMKIKRELKIGDKITVEFQLNDANKTLVKKESVIRSIVDPYVGVEFCAPDATDASTQALAFYLF